MLQDPAGADAHAHGEMGDRQRLSHVVVACVFSQPGLQDFFSRLGLYHEIEYMVEDSAERVYEQEHRAVLFD